MDRHQILSDIEIQEIEFEARTSKFFRYGTSMRLVTNSSHSFKQIVCVSDKGLILIKGNLETGHEHIQVRHSFWAIERFPNNELTGFQAQSKFPENIPPIEYVKIADRIYIAENFIPENIHPDSDKFEKYQGNYPFDGVNDEKVNLILYKGTKIIHSLYPQSGKKYNRDKNKTKYPFAKGEVSVEYNDRKAYGNVEIPYYNVLGKLSYLIIIEKFFTKQIEKIKVVAFNDNREYRFYVDLGERKLIKFKGETYERITYQYRDLKDFENIILKIHVDAEDKQTGV